ncbi:S-layer homology domain-containing protein [Bacillus mycoides]
MKKILKCMFSIVVVTVFLLSNLKNASASEKGNEVITKEAAQRKAEIYVQAIGKQSYPNWIDSKFSESKTLKDLDGKEKGYLFQIQKDNQELGYVIVNGSVNGNSVIESTRKGSNPYEGIAEDQVIYTGPLQYFKKEGEKVINLSTGQTEELKSLKIVSKKNMKTELVSKPFIQWDTTEIYKEKRIKDVPDYVWYRGCSPTAFANIVAYWSKQVFPNLHTSNNDHQLIDDLGDDMKTMSGYRSPDGKLIDGGGTYETNMVPGINQYFKSRGYTVFSEYMLSPTYEKYKNEIDGGRPLAVNIHGHSMYKDHTVTGVAYEELHILDLNEKYQNVIFHDTWTPVTPVEVMLDYNEISKYISSFVTINPFVFIDVPKGHWAYDQIMYMAGNKIMTGYGNEYFGAQDNMTREQLAAFLYRYLKPVDTNENTYVDINDNPFKKEITALTKRGIFSVNSEKKFNPKNTATRAGIAAVLTKAFNLKVKANYEFNDMKGHWANEYVKALYSNGIANGIGNKNFGPSANVAREQMAMFLYKAINLDPNYTPNPI